MNTTFAEKLLIVICLLTILLAFLALLPGLAHAQVYGPNTQYALSSHAWVNNRWFTKTLGTYPTTEACNADLPRAEQHFQTLGYQPTGGGYFAKVNPSTGSTFTITFSCQPVPQGR